MVEAFHEVVGMDLMGSAYMRSLVQGWRRRLICSMAKRSGRAHRL